MVFKYEFCLVETNPLVERHSSYFITRNQRSQYHFLLFIFFSQLHVPVEKVRVLATRQKFDAANKEEIDKFFKELRIKVLVKIDEVYTSMI